MAVAPVGVVVPKRVVLGAAIVPECNRVGPPFEAYAELRGFDLSDLVDEPWIFPPRGNWHYARIEEAFQARGLDIPQASLVSLSVTLRTQLMAAGPYISVFGSSVMRLNAHRYNIAVLPVDLPYRPWPVVVVTLKNRTLSPVVERFIACAHEVAKSFANRPRGRG